MFCSFSVASGKKIYDDRYCGCLITGFYGRNNCNRNFTVNEFNHGNRKYCCKFLSRWEKEMNKTSETKNETSVK